MANIKELIQSIESPDSSFDEKLAVINEMQDTLVAMKEQEAIDDNVELIIEALRTIEAKVEAKLRIIPEKGEQGIQGQKGEQGDRGLDGAQGKDGKSGIDGKDGLDGKDGVSVQDAKIDFDGSLVITLSDGREINVGEVVPVDVAEKIRTVHNIQSGSGGDSQTVLDAIAALQATIATYGTMATQNANAVAITGGTINNTTIGATTPSTGVFTTLTANTTFQFGASSANYGEGTGGATTKAVEFKTLGSDTNVAYAIRTKGTGAIDLAAGSSGVNISNGGTVTAITRTAQGSNYTSAPSVSISAPTTAGGVQATVSAYLRIFGETLTSGGTGYTVNDIITFVGGTGISTASYRVTSVSAGVVTGISLNTAGGYTTVPSNPISVTGGTGTGATITVTNWGVDSVFTITNAGSGYVEQPTVTFSGGGGSGAAAYAVVGGGAVIRSIGVNSAVVTNQAITFETAGSSSSRPAFVIRDIGTGDSWYQMGGGSTQTFLIAKGNANASAYLGANGSGSIRLTTNGDSITEQLRVAHTASAVNYVQVTGSATSAGAGALSGVYFNGSDSNINGAIVSKGTGYIAFAGGFSSSAQAFRVLTNNAVNTGNLIAVQGAASGSSPSIQAISGSSGTDANIDIIFTPKGATGNVRFGTYTASVLTPTGYVEIKDSGGTVRRLLVG